MVLMRFGDWFRNDIHSAKGRARQRLIRSRERWKIVNQCNPSGLDYSSAIALTVGSKNRRPIFYVIVTSTSYSASIDCKILSAVLSIHAHHTKIFYYFIRARCSFNCVIVYLLLWKKIWSLKQIQIFRIFQIRSTWRLVTDNGCRQ